MNDLPIELIQEIRSFLPKKKEVELIEKIIQKVEKIFDTEDILNDGFSKCFFDCFFQSYLSLIGWINN